jgi:2-iminoacetate synthase ThiH
MYIHIFIYRYGHIENEHHIASHLDTLRTLQHQSQDKFGGLGITEFVPLSFVSKEAPMYLNKVLSDMRGGPTGIFTLYTHVYTYAI